MLPENQRTYWARFANLNWGWSLDRLNGPDGAYIRPQIESTLANEAHRYVLFGGQPDFQGWFKNRPDEYAAYIAEYGGVPVSHQNTGTGVYQPTDAAAVAAQLHAAEQGIVTAFNQGPLSVLPTNTGAVTGGLFTTGGGVYAPGSSVPLGTTIAVPPNVSQPGVMPPPGSYVSTGDGGYAVIQPFPDQSGGGVGPVQAEIGAKTLLALAAAAMFLLR